MSSLILVLSIVIHPASADEGMWLPEQMPQVAEQYPELQVDPTLLADPTGSLLGSVVSLGGCTGSFVSDSGLLITNHHCVEGYLQAISDESHNRWRDGYVAPTLADELPTGPAGMVWITRDMTDVTDDVLAGIRPRTRDAQRARLIEDNTKTLIERCEGDAEDLRCSLAPLDGGARYLLIESRQIKDLRVVWAPPRSVGQFGGDVDNWEWPRHGFDGALLRAYVAPDGSSAPYSEDNVPYTPASFLPVSDGLSEGDLAMVAGYPGRTQRRRLAEELASDIEEDWMRSVELADRWLPLMKAHAASSDDAEARLGPTISGFENTRKNRMGVLEGVARSGGLARMQAQEAEVLAWIRADRRRARMFEPAYEELRAAIAESRRVDEEQLHVRRLRYASDLLSVALYGVRWATEQAEPDAERKPGFQERDREPVARWFDSMDRSLYLPAERELVADVLTDYVAAPPSQHLPSLDAWLAGFDNDVSAAVGSLYDDAPALVEADARRGLLDADVAALGESEDPFVQLAIAMEADLAPRRTAAEARSARMQRLRSAWASAEVAFAEGTGTLRSPDANSTLRVSVGRVGGYSPRDGIQALPFTTLSGFAAKAGPAPFDAPEALVTAAQQGASSSWAVASLGDVPLDLLVDLDITGGNSGSPLLDAQGRIAGLLFDGVWESVANDYAYDTEMNRAIALDIRAIGWLLANTEGTNRVADELGLAR